MELSLLTNKDHKSRTISTTIDSISNNYRLNIAKALQKKLDATRRDQHVEYKLTNGGMVITADTATFELIRLASIHFYNSTQWSADEVNIRKHTDNSN